MSATLASVPCMESMSFRVIRNMDCSFCGRGQEAICVKPSAAKATSPKRMGD